MFIPYINLIPVQIESFLAMSRDLQYEVTGMTFLSLFTLFKQTSFDVAVISIRSLDIMGQDPQAGLITTNKLT